MKEHAALPETLQPESSFHFSCNKELACFNLCCRDINLYLTPYDILRLKRRLDISSADFLKTYTIPLFPKEIGHPVVLLRMIPDEAKNCPFVGEDGCMVYDDRPWSCRSFPLEPVDGGFQIVRREFCLGFGTGKHNHTARKWRTTQNVTLYEEMNEEWKEITHHERFSTRNLLEGRDRDVFFLGSYNLDEFRNVVLNGNLQDYFILEKATVKKIRSSETELLKFAFRWLRNVLFGDDTLRRR